MPPLITSQQNARIKNVMLLLEKPRARREQKRMVIEGLREVKLALAGGFQVKEIFFCHEIADPAALAELEREIDGDARVYEVSAGVYSKMAYREGSGGVIALAEIRRLTFDDLRPAPMPLCLVLETVEKPGNLGALLRTADAAGLDAVIICDPQTDIWNPNAIRASLGCIFTVPVITATTEQTIQRLRELGVRTFATALPATGFYQDANFRQPAAIIMGSEAFGLSDAWLSGADELIRIPMRGKVDSLNVSASAAIVVYEALRQRGL